MKKSPFLFKWLIIAILLVILTVIVYFFTGQSTAESQTSVPLAPKGMIPSQMDSGMQQAKANVSPEGVPPDVPPEEWAQVQAALNQTEEGRKQLPRVGEFLTFKHRAQLWNDLHKQGDHSSQTQQLARQLLNDISTHLQRSEITAFEAKSLAAQLLSDTISDPTLLRQALADETQKMEAAAPKPSPQEAVDNSRYAEAQKVIVAQWQALDPAQRDPKLLEAQLETARRNTFVSARGAVQ